VAKRATFANHALAMSGVLVVTGAASGMGLASAETLAPGHALLLLDLRADPLAQAAQRLGCESIAGDLCDAETLRRLVERVGAAGGCSGLVHGAGLSPTMAEAKRLFEVNLVATARLVDALEPLLLRDAAGVLFASQAAHLIARVASPEIDALLDDPLHPDLYDRLAAAAGPLATSSGGAYALSKRGVQRLAVARAPAWGARDARLVSLSPGVVDTEMGRSELSAQTAAMESIIAATPVGKRMGRAAELASVVAFLCSDAASFVSGVDLLVDGGSTNQLLRRTF
jgi:NAD(P)-dependent dehydrogenase (short-subunit alcohol dehydrogenase family)